MLSFRRSISPIRIIFITSIVILAALSVFSYKNNLELIRKANLVNHTNVVKFELQNTVTEIKDAETGVRAYYLTGLREYLVLYFQSLKDVPVSLNTLDSLLADNPKQVKNIQRLRRLSGAKFSFLKAIEDSAVTGNKNASMLITSREEMDDINAQINIMISEEDRLLRIRTATLNDAVSFAPNMNMLLAGFAILLLVFSYFKIIRELEKSNELRKEISASNEVLEKSNNELAQFAYVASHDLQEPLRKIQTFISRIYDTETNLSDKGKDYFSRVNSSAKRMQQLIRDILSYSRIDSSDNKFTRIDLNTALDVAKDQLEEFIKERHAVVKAGKLPSVNAVQYQLEQLFQNLLSNALKFARPGVPGIITVSADIVKGSAIQNPAANKNITYHRITIADNGIGFDQQYGERIFKIFHRLNTKEEYDGNGIGLSIVKKIMETHGGFITATGRINEGAAFSIHIPA